MQTQSSQERTGNIQISTWKCKHTFPCLGFNWKEHLQILVFWDQKSRNGFSFFSPHKDFADPKKLLGMS